jgi:GT2 family glycosyltransferase
MSAKETSVPVVLFAYARPNHLSRTLDSLRANGVPTIYAFSDGPRTSAKRPAVAEVRRILRAVDWCEVTLIERETLDPELAARLGSKARGRICGKFSMGKSLGVYGASLNWPSSGTNRGRQVRNNERNSSGRGGHTYPQ